MSPPSLATLLITCVLSINITPAKLQSIDNLFSNKFNTQDFEGWNCGKITTCGNLGQFCGGYNVKGQGSEIKKTFMLPAGFYSLELDFIRIDSWDSEDAYVSVNGETCWTKTAIAGTSGTQQCGGFFKEERFRVTGCDITLSGSEEANIPLTVRVWTNLDGGADDESFGIDNVVIAKRQENDKDSFKNPRNFEGWNCGKITTCGNLGQVCGGYNVKGQGSEIKKTFMLPAGSYSVELNFIKIDSWDNEDAYVSVNGKTCWTRTDVLGTVGTQQCGGFFKEEGFRVRGCYATLSASEGLTVRVWTNLDGAANDESFGINNVVITKIEEVPTTTTTTTTTTTSTTTTTEASTSSPPTTTTAPPPTIAGCNGEQDAARVLGFTSVTWDNLSGTEQQPATIDKAWIDLTDDEKAAAMILGFTRLVWDTPVPAAAEKYWASLSEFERAAAEALGFTELSWDNKSGNEIQPPSTRKPWSEMTGQELAALLFLGFDQSNWDNWLTGGLPESLSKPWSELSSCDTTTTVAVTEKPSSGCPKCGLIKKSKISSCCARGGTWYNDCGNEGDSKFGHTWAEGVGVCKGPPDDNPPVTANPGSGCPKCGLIKKSNKLSCCAPGGAWYNQCGGSSKAKYTWTEGIRACKGPANPAATTKPVEPTDTAVTTDATDTDTDTTTASVSSGCPKCGLIKKSKKLSCCARGGAWYNNCGNEGDSRFDHTWTEGVDTCKGPANPAATTKPVEPTDTAVTTDATDTDTDTDTTDTATTTAAVSESTGCPKCGFIKKSKISSCCARGGAWYNNCGNEGDSKFGHTWAEGVRVCKGPANPPDDGPPVTANPSSGCPQCGTTKKSGKRSCCARGGAWYNNCGDEGDSNFDHTWTDGIRSCFFADAQAQLKTTQERNGSQKEIVAAAYSVSGAIGGCGDLSKVTSFIAVLLIVLHLRA